MNPTIKEMTRPTKDERIAALASYKILESALKVLKSENPEIEIEETQEKIKIPKRALKLLASVLYKLSKGHSVSIVSDFSEVTTQTAAEMLGCSRPFLVSLLEDNKIPYTKVGRHRRIRVEDVLEYKSRMKIYQKSLLIDMMKADEESGLYDI